MTSRPITGRSAGLAWRMSRPIRILTGCRRRRTGGLEPEAHVAPEGEARGDSGQTAAHGDGVDGPRLEPERHEDLGPPVPLEPTRVAGEIVKYGDMSATPSWSKVSSIPVVVGTPVAVSPGIVLRTWTGPRTWNAHDAALAPSGVLRSNR